METKSKENTQDSGLLSKAQLEEIKKECFIPKEKLDFEFFCENDPTSIRDNYQSAKSLLQDSERNRDITKILKAIGVPKRYIHAKKDDIEKNNWEGIEDFLLGQREGLFLHGDTGTGKTYLAVAIIDDMVQKKKARLQYRGRSEFLVVTPGYLSIFSFISVPDLLLEIRKTFITTSRTYDWQAGEERPRTEDEVIKYYSEIPVLVLDDLGVEQTSKWSLQTLYSIIDHRYRDLRLTIITSNLSLDKVANKVGDRIASRIAGMCKIIEMQGKDRRL